MQNKSQNKSQNKRKREKRLDIDLVFKIAAIGIIVAVLNQLLIRSGREDQAMMTTLAGLIVVLSMLVQQISTLFVTIKALFDL
jgi:stage III sporulation protein AC